LQQQSCKEQHHQRHLFWCFHNVKAPKMTSEAPFFSPGDLSFASHHHSSKEETPG
jgi:hypothetical protein